MSLSRKRLLFYFVWLLFILSGPVTIFRNVLNFSDITQNPLVLTSLIQRLTGLLAFTLIFIQIMLGAYMAKWIEFLGAKPYWFHITQGLFAYGLMLIHPLMETAMVYLVSKSIIDALYVFWPSITSSRDINLLYGKIALLLASIAVVAAYFRTHPFFRKNWKAFHVLNYFVFYLVVFHTLNLATDISFFPFNIFYWLMVILVSLTIVYKLALPIFLKFKPAPEASKNEVVPTKNKV